MRIVLVLACFLLFGCMPEPEDEALTSEDVASMWLNLFYKDDLEKAKTFSTKKTEKQLDDLAKVIFTEEAFAKKPFTIRLDSCARRENEHIWYFTFKDAEETFEDSLFMVKDPKTQRWLVDQRVFEQ